MNHKALCSAVLPICVITLPEAVGDGGVLFDIHRKIQEVLIFAAYLKTKAKLDATESAATRRHVCSFAPQN